MDVQVPPTERDAAKRTIGTFRHRTLGSPPLPRRSNTFLFAVAALHAPLLYLQHGVAAGPTERWDDVAAALKKEAPPCTCPQVTVQLNHAPPSKKRKQREAGGDGDAAETTVAADGCIKFHACFMPALCRAVVAAAGARVPQLFTYASCTAQFASVSPTMQRLTSPRAKQPPQVSATVLAMLVLDACIDVAAGPARLDAAALYDLASDWMEHRGWSVLSRDVPQFAKHAKQHAETLSELEGRCSCLYRVLTGDCVPDVAFSRRLDGIKLGMSRVPDKRRRLGRTSTFKHRRASVADAEALLLESSRFGACHVLRCFARRVPHAVCMVLPSCALDALVQDIEFRADEEQLMPCCVALGKDEVVLAASGPVIDAFASGVASHRPASHRTSHSVCFVDDVVTGFLDDTAPTSVVLKATTTLWRLICQDVQTKPTSPAQLVLSRIAKSRARRCSADPSRTSSPVGIAAAMAEAASVLSFLTDGDGDDRQEEARLAQLAEEERCDAPRRTALTDAYVTAVADQSDVTDTLASEEAVGDHVRQLPATLRSLYGSDIFGLRPGEPGIVSGLRAVWCMPPAAYVRPGPNIAHRQPAGDSDASSPAAAVATTTAPEFEGILLAPQFDDGTDPAYAQSLVVRLQSAPTDLVLHCHSNLLCGVLGFLMPARRHRLDARLVGLLEAIVDALMIAYDPDPPVVLRPGPGAEGDAAFLEYLDTQPYGSLKARLLQYRRSDAAVHGEPLCIRCGRELEAFYNLCRDESVPLVAPRAMRAGLFCSIATLQNELFGPLYVRFPAPRRHPPRHGNCREHSPASPLLTSASLDSELDAIKDACDATAAFRVFVDLASHGASLQMRRPPEGRDGENAYRYGPDMFFAVSVPPKRGAPRRGRSPAEEGAATPAFSPLPAPAVAAAPRATGSAAEVTIERATGPRCPFLEGCQRALAFFVPNSGRELSIGAPCLSACAPRTPTAPAAENDRTGALWNRLPVAAMPPGDVPLCGRFAPTDTSRQCLWCMFGDMPPNASPRHVPPEQKRQLKTGVCRRCTVRDVPHHPLFHRECAYVLSALTPVALPTCPVCLRVYAQTDADMASVYTAQSICVGRDDSKDAKDPRPLPRERWNGSTPYVSCCVCGADKVAPFAWTFVHTEAGVQRYDFDCEACANAFDASLDSQVAIAADPADHPMYTFAKHPWRRSFLKFNEQQQK